jgi:hypothetical protein
MENSHRHLKGLQDTSRAANKMTLVEGGLFDDAYKLFVEPVIRNTHTNANTNMLGMYTPPSYPYSAPPIQILGTDF